LNSSIKNTIKNVSEGGARRVLLPMDCVVISQDETLKYYFERRFHNDEEKLVEYLNKNIGPEIDRRHVMVVSGGYIAIEFY